MANVVVTDPSYDPPTKHISHWVHLVVNLITQSTHHNAVLLSGKDVSRDELKKNLKNHKPGLVLLNGHGTESSVLGHNDHALVECGDDTSILLRNALVHSWTCQAGKLLGHELIKLGTLAFIGYKENFKFIHTSTDPSHDPVADLFLEPAHETMVALSSGEKAGDAYSRSQRMSANNILVVLASPSPHSQTIAAHLWHNRAHQVMLGDAEAALQP